MFKFRLQNYYIKRVNLLPDQSVTLYLSLEF